MLYLDYHPRTHRHACSESRVGNSEEVTTQRDWADQRGALTRLTPDDFGQPGPQRSRSSLAFLLDR